MRKPASRKPKAVSIDIEDKPFLPVNPNCEPLTIEKVRKFPGFENIPDQVALELIDFISAFADILFDYRRAKENAENKGDSTMNTSKNAA